MTGPTVRPLPKELPRHFLADPLTPASSDDYLDRLDVHVRALKDAAGALVTAWDQRNHARWPRTSCNLREMVPSDHPLVTAAEARIEEARVTWRAAQRELARFLGEDVALRCGVQDWRKNHAHVFCALPATHDGRHDFELEIHVERIGGES